jgi:hypothetical protein
MTPGELVIKWRGEAVTADSVQTVQTTDTARMARMAAKAIAQCKRQDAQELEAALAQGGGDADEILIQRADLAEILETLDKAAKPGALCEMLMSNPPMQAVPYSVAKFIRAMIATADAARALPAPAGGA